MPSKKEMFIGFAGQDLQTVKAYLEDLMSSWNGSDDQFSHHGDAYCEDDVHAAQEIVERIDELQEMFNNFLD